MGGFLSSIMERWGKFYRRSSIQVILSLSFTAVAVAGMIFLGLTLFLRFSASNNAQLAKNSQRVLAQVNLNLDAYLRGMMRVSDTMYYRVIKNADLESDSLDAQMALLYESNRDSLVSIAVFAQSGELVSATPLATLKKSVFPSGRTGSPRRWTGSRTSTFPRPTSRICSRTRTTATAGWSPSAGRWS